MLTMAILQLSLILNPAIAPDEDRAAGWGLVTHQTVVVKATSLIPPGLKRQILRHRADVIRGVSEVLEGSAGGDAAIVAEYTALVADLRATAPFSRICQRLGRLSTLLAEEASPLKQLATGEARQFAEFLAGELKNLPLVINTEGEEFLARGDISAYLSWRRHRNELRRKTLNEALHHDRDSMDWRNQRSAVWGAAVLCYNDLVLDTARLWLRAWEDGGGGVGDAPYFRLDTNGKR